MNAGLELPFSNNQHTIHEYELNVGTRLRRLLKSGVVADRLRIEDR